MTRSSDPASVYYTEKTTTSHYEFSSDLNHPESHQAPFDDWVYREVTIILHGTQFEDFIRRANVELMPVSRFRELFEVSAGHDTCGRDDEPLQYNITFREGLGEQDDEILAFLRQWDPRNHGWPIRGRGAQ